MSLELGLQHWWKWLPGRQRQQAETLADPLPLTGWEECRDEGERGEESLEEDQQAGGNANISA
jgi:hypothetical protein